jgi:hypothetical protein
MAYLTIEAGIGSSSELCWILSRPVTKRLLSTASARKERRRECSPAVNTDRMTHNGDAQGSKALGEED